MPRASTAAARVDFGRSDRRTSAESASTPPSPALSARSTSPTYLAETTRVTDQKTSEMTP
jgi:hypothetical protein